MSGGGGIGELSYVSGCVAETMLKAILKSVLMLVSIDSEFW